MWNSNLSSTSEELRRSKASRTLLPGEEWGSRRLHSSAPPSPCSSAFARSVIFPAAGCTRSKACESRLPSASSSTAFLCSSPSYCLVGSSEEYYNAGGACFAGTMTVNPAEVQVNLPLDFEPVVGSTEFVSTAVHLDMQRDCEL